MAFIHTHQQFALAIYAGGFKLSRFGTSPAPSSSNYADSDQRNNVASQPIVRTLGRFMLRPRSEPRLSANNQMRGDIQCVIQCGNSSAIDVLCGEQR